MAIKFEEERFQVEEFIKYYNKCNGMEYRFKCRPEDKSNPISKQFNGTYDFLYEELYGRGLTLAIELGGIYKSEADMKYSDIYQKFIEELRHELAKELAPTMECMFNIDFNRVPLRHESAECKGKIARLLKDMSMAYDYKGNPQRIVRTLRLNGNLRIDCSILAVNPGKGKIIILSNRNGGYAEHISDELSNNSFLEVILGNDGKLEIPKKEGKGTVLLAVNAREGHSFPEPSAMKLMVQQRPSVHSNIDQIYLLNRKINGNDFDVDKIK